MINLGEIMRNPVLVGAALAASTVILLAGGSVAFAQETGPFTVACREATDKYDKAADADKAYDDAQKEHDRYLGAKDKAKTFWDNHNFKKVQTDEGGKPSVVKLDWSADLTPKDVQDAIDSFTPPATLPDGVTTWPTIQNAGQYREFKSLVEAMQTKDRKDDGALLDLKNKAEKEDAGKLRDKANEACGVVTTTPQTPPPAVDLNCSDFPRPDGTTAQQELERDRTDPHGIDGDKNGVACDGVGDPTTVLPVPPADNGGVGNVTTPSGGVQTGGGPA